MSEPVLPGRGTMEPARKGSNPVEDSMLDVSTRDSRYMCRFGSLTMVHGSLLGAPEREAR